MFDFKKSIKVGIDFGTKNIKVVRLKKNGPEYELLGYGIHKASEENKIKEFFNKHELDKGDIRINSNHISLKVRRVEIPAMSDEEIPEASKWSLKDVLSGNLDDYLFRVIKLPNSLNKNENILLTVFAIKKEITDSRIKHVKKFNLAPTMLAPNISVLRLLVSKFDKEEKASQSLIVEIGNKLSLLGVIYNKFLLFSRLLPGISGEILTRNISRDLNVSLDEADEMKMKYDDKDKEQNVALANTISHFFSKITIEIQRSMDAFKLFEFEGVPDFSKLYLSGGGVYLSGLVKHLEDFLQIPATLLNPFLCVDTTRFKGSNLADRAALYTVACGLAMD